MVSGPRGTFSPEAHLSLKAGGAMAPMARIAAATADTADLVRKVVENTAQLVTLAKDSDVFAPP